MLPDSNHGGGAAPVSDGRIRILVNDRVNPVALEPYEVPRVRWRLDPMLAADDSVCSARVIVADRPNPDMGNGFSRDSVFTWESGIRPIDELNGAALPEVPMGPSERYWLMVELLDAQEQVVFRSRAATLGTGPGSRWSAQAIWTERDESPQAQNRTQNEGGNAWGWAFLRGVVALPAKPVRWATLNATASSTRPARQFVYRLWMNGAFQGCGPVFPLGDEARYDGYDVGGILQPGGDNFIGVIAYATSDQRFAAQLDVCFEDGQVEHYGTDASWKALPGGAAFPDSASIGTGYYRAPAEDIVLSSYPGGLSTAGFDDRDWPPARVKEPFDHCLASPVDSLQTSYLHPKDIRRTTPKSVLLDFGSVVMGGIRLRATLSGGMDLLIRYGEVVQDDDRVRYHLTAGNVYEDRWRMAAGEHVAETWGIRVFRYAELSCEEPGEAWEELVSAVAAGQVEAAALLTPAIDTHADFRSSRPVLDRVWKLGRDTVTRLNANIYVDSWTRERAPYEADAWIQQRAHQALDDAPSIGRYTVDYLMENRTWPTEWPLYSILAVHDAWMSTGDLGQMRSRYRRLCSLLPFRYLDRESGLVVKEPGRSSQMDGDLVDWPESERDGYLFGRVNTVVNALSSRAFADMADMAKALGRHGDAVLFARVASRMRAAINDRLYDPSAGAYWDGLDHGPSGRPLAHHSLHASAFALAFAEPPRGRIERVGDFLRGRGMACSVYVAAVYLDGLYRSGLGADATALISATTGLRTWNHMLDQGSGGTMEAWDPCLKPNTTYSHPWAASPVYLLPSGLMGIRPLEPGYRSLACIPQPGDLEQASVVLPLPRGDLSVGYRTSGPVRTAGGRTSLSGIRMELDLPQGCRAHLVLPPMTGVGAGQEVAVTVDGVDTVVKAEGDGLVLGRTVCPRGSLPLEPLGAGAHTVSACSPLT